jgi:hypothetical protein
MARPFAALLMACLWPIQSAVDARREARRIDLAAFPGCSRAATARAAWHAALRHNIPPLEYFAYRVAEAPGTPPDAWILQGEVTRLLAMLARPEARRLAADKLDFASFCEAHGFASVPTLARLGAGLDAPEPAEPAVIIKPRIGANGRAISLWWHTPDAWRPEGGGEGTAWTGVQSRVLVGAGGEMLVQPFLRPHPALSRHCVPGSGAARIVTGLWPDGRAEALYASFAVPPAGAVTSNGGPRRMVELGSGRLLPAGPGRRRDVFGGADDGAALEGLILPDWPAALELTLAAHHAFPPRAVLLGWDVALTPEGPVLIEVNTGLSFFLEQYETLVPAGDQRAAALIAAWLE